MLKLPVGQINYRRGLKDKKKSLPKKMINKTKTLKRTVFKTNGTEST